MRLSKQQRALIIDTIDRMVGADASVYLFGSRLDDLVKGGDVDLLIESDKPLPLIQRAQIKMQLESLLGLPVDIVAKTKGMAVTSFQAIAQFNAVKLSVFDLVPNNSAFCSLSHRERVRVRGYKSESYFQPIP